MSDNTTYLLIDKSDHQSFGNLLLLVRWILAGYKSDYILSEYHVIRRKLLKDNSIEYGKYIIERLETKRTKFKTK